MGTGGATWHRWAVLGALMLAAFTFNTAENLPVGLLELIAAGLHVPVPAVGYLVTGYGLTVAVASLPLAHATRVTPRRHVLTGLLAALIVSSLAAALAGSYGVLLAARLLTALAQALFWAVMGPVAVGLFAPAVRGRVVGAVSVAGSLALVFGVPAGTWLGEHTSWPVPVGSLAVLGAVCLVPIAALLPTTRPGTGHAARGSAPDARRFATVLVAGALSATGAFAAYTYIVRFLGDVGGFPRTAISPLLLAFGLACLGGVTVTGALLDRFPRATPAAAIGVQSAAILGLSASAGDRALMLTALALLGAALGPVFLATQNAMLHCAPKSTDIALAANSGVYNAGIAAGAALGGLLLPVTGIARMYVIAGLISTAGCAVLVMPRAGVRRGSPVRRR